MPFGLISFTHHSIAAWHVLLFSTERLSEHFMEAATKSWHEVRNHQAKNGHDIIEYEKA